MNIYKLTKCTSCGRGLVWKEKLRFFLAWRYRCKGCGSIYSVNALFIALSICVVAFLSSFVGAMSVDGFWVSGFLFTLMVWAFLISMPQSWPTYWTT